MHCTFLRAQRRHHELPQQVGDAGDRGADRRSRSGIPGATCRFTDNILDLEYFKDFVPLLASGELGVDLFYETKANLGRTRSASLKQAGITKVQPGIESLIDDVLKLMRKGVGALHNIQLLKWCTGAGSRAALERALGVSRRAAGEYQRPRERRSLAAASALARQLRSYPPRSLQPQLLRRRAARFKGVQPLTPYRHVYPSFRKRSCAICAYYFSYWLSGAAGRGRLRAAAGA
jgi:hypothetical protein